MYQNLILFFTSHLTIPLKFSQNQYGYKKEDGSWTGLVGDLISGEIDISVATLTMTTEREEVIDFVAPYFDQSGISILLRKKAPERNIFKFMTVLRPEVWYGILGAVIGTVAINIKSQQETKKVPHGGSGRYFQKIVQKVYGPIMIIEIFLDLK